MILVVDSFQALFLREYLIAVTEEAGGDNAPGAATLDGRRELIRSAIPRKPLGTPQRRFRS